MTGKGTGERRTAGFGLVELMVALLLGILVLGAVLAVYLSNTQAAKFQTGLMRVQENGRFAIDVMSRSIRMAGYDDPDTTTPSETVGANFIQGTTGSAGAKWAKDNLKSDAATVAVDYEGGADIRDCRGAPVAAGTVVSNQLAVWINDDGVGRLICSTANGNERELAEGVENMQVLYGIDSNDDGVANRYVDADDVGNWTQVVSLQITLLVNSIEGAVSPGDMVCLGCNVFAGTQDGLIRAEFQTTIGIRN
jgi:type IV pilus assembly protein PilW